MSLSRGCLTINPHCRRQAQRNHQYLHDQQEHHHPKPRLRLRASVEDLQTDDGIIPPTPPLSPPKHMNCFQRIFQPVTQLSPCPSQNLFISNEVQWRNYPPTPCPDPPNTVNYDVFTTRRQENAANTKDSGRHENEKLQTHEIPTAPMRKALRVEEML